MQSQLHVYSSGSKYLNMWSPANSCASEACGIWSERNRLMLFQFYSKPHYTFIGDNHLMGCSNLSTHKTTLIPAGWIGVLHVASHFAWLREFYLSFLLFFFFFSFKKNVWIPGIKLKRERSE